MQIAPSQDDRDNAWRRYLSFGLTRAIASVRREVMLGASALGSVQEWSDRAHQGPANAGQGDSREYNYQSVVESARPKSDRCRDDSHRTCSRSMW